MKPVASGATREVLGCFVMLVSGTLTGVGFLAVLMNAWTNRPGGTGLSWRSFVIRVVGPALVTVLALWVVYGFNASHHPKGVKNNNGSRKS
jgi:hypothetical protein